MKSNYKIIITIYLFVSFLLGIFYIAQSEMYREYETATKREELNRLSQMLNTLATSIENKDAQALEQNRQIILKSGYVSSLSSDNRNAVYDFLTIIRIDDENEISLQSSYARKCAYCSKEEIKGKKFVLPYYKSERIKSSMHRFIYGDEYCSNYSVIENEKSICKYKGNIYSIKEKEDPLFEEFVSYVGLELNDLNLQSYVQLYDDEDISFYIGAQENLKILIGIDNAGKISHYKKLS